MPGHVRLIEGLGIAPWNGTVLPDAQTLDLECMAEPTSDGWEESCRTRQRHLTDRSCPNSVPNLPDAKQRIEWAPWWRKSGEPQAASCIGFLVPGWPDAEKSKCICFRRQAEAVKPEPTVMPNVGDEAQTTAAQPRQKRLSIDRRCLSPRLTG